MLGKPGEIDVAAADLDPLQGETGVAQAGQIRHHAGVTLGFLQGEAAQLAHQPLHGTQLLLPGDELLLQQAVGLMTGQLGIEPLGLAAPHIERRPHLSQLTADALLLPGVTEADDQHQHQADPPDQRHLIEAGPLAPGTKFGAVEVDMTLHRSAPSAAP
ncbi:hypothetical protein D3C80_1445210 [compost metagenome]